MEGIVGLAVLVGIAILAFRSRRSGRHDASTPPVDLRRTPTPINRPTPFDAASAAPLPQKETLTGAAYITDGDTIKIKKTQIRLFGIDAPELNHPYGKKVACMSGKNSTQGRASNDGRVLTVRAGTLRGLRVFQHRAQPRPVVGVFQHHT